MSKNRVEAYALLKGLTLAKSSQIQNLTVLGDSGLIIQHMQFNSNPAEPRLSSILERIKQNFS